MEAQRIRPQEQCFLSHTDGTVSGHDSKSIQPAVQPGRQSSSARCGLHWSVKLNSRFKIRNSLSVANGAIEMIGLGRYLMCKQQNVV
jgi:hypothetical protein